MHEPPPPLLNMLVARQLEDLGSGNGAYLLIFLRAAKASGHGVRIVFAPEQSFGNRPWMSVHPAFTDLAEEIVVPASAKAGGRFVSLSARVWSRFFVRLVLEAARRFRSGGNTPPPFPSRLADELAPREAMAMARDAQRRPASITVAEYSSLASVLRLVSNGGRKACLVHDLFSMRAAAFRSSGERPDFAEMSLEEEISRLSPAETLFFASANEMGRVAPALPGSACLWLRPETQDWPEGGARGPARIVFIGTRHAGNTDALVHFLETAWPVLHERYPGLEFWIAGAAGLALSPSLAQAEGVRVLGRVERRSEIGGADSIGVAPTRLASGVSTKVAEYLRLGMPCVCYPTALEGFAEVLNDLVEVASEKADLVASICALIEDVGKRERMSRRGREEAARRLDNGPVVGYLANLAHEHRSASDQGEM